jgi:hypothetical protein
MTFGTENVETTFRGFAMRKFHLLAAATVAWVGLTVAASATLISVTFSDYGVPPGALVPPGETSVSLAGAVFTGGSSLVSGSVPDVYAAPATSATTVVTGTYLAAEPGGTASLALGAAWQKVEIYVGSLDTYNSISFTSAAGTVTYTGAELASMTGAIADSNQVLGTSNGLFSFFFTPGEAATSVSFLSTSPALEVASVSVSPTIPEPSTWAMMVIGFIGLGYAAFRRNAKDQSAVSPI